MYSAFDWETPKVVGQPFKVSASEWNLLIKAIKTRLANNDKDISEYPLDLATKEKGISHMQFNQVVAAIDAFNSTNLEAQENGNGITTAMLNTLKTKVNLG